MGSAVREIHGQLVEVVLCPTVTLEALGAMSVSRAGWDIIEEGCYHKCRLRGERDE